MSEGGGTKTYNRIGIIIKGLCRTGVAAVFLCTIFTSFTQAAKTEETTLKDADITLAVENQLFLDPGVSSRLIDVNTTEGVVTLSGSVDNLLAKERATKVVQALKGVRSVVNNITVIPVLRTDDQIHNDVVLALAQDPVADSYELNVAVKDGVVTLRGVVESWAEKQIASQVVKTVQGVKGVTNDITIDYKFDRPDSEISAEVQRRLQQDVLVDADFIDVSVNDGNVALSGTVGSAAEKAQASQDAWVSGVASVDDNNLQVVWWKENKDLRETRNPIKSDEAIKQAVKDALLYDPRVLSFNPTVYVQDGAVTLTGVVNNLLAKEAAEDDARNTVGVWRVKNYLKVRPAQPQSDAVIARNIRDALKWNPYINRFDINVTVQDGAAYLTGVVDSPFEQERAEQVASSVKGVVEVKNYLTTREAWAWKSDQAIKEDIQSEFFWSPYVDADQISVSVHNGVATLTGTVDSLRELGAAIANAREGGALRVDSDLKVRGWPSGSPLALRFPLSAPIL